MIRRLRDSDIPETAEYVSEALATEFVKVGEGGYSPDEAGRDIIFGKDNGWLQLIFELEGSNVGYIAGEVDEVEGDIITLVVKNGQRSHGIGTALFDDIIGRFKEQGVRKVNLSAHYGNKDAMEFFRKRGFTERTVEMSWDVI